MAILNGVVSSAVFGLVVFVASLSGWAASGAIGTRDASGFRRCPLHSQTSSIPCEFG